VVAEPLRWRTPFGRFVQQRTVRRLARDLSQLGVPMTSHTVYDWISGRHAPRPACAAAIVQVSGGKLTFSDIYRHRTEMQTLSTMPSERREGTAGARK